MKLNERFLDRETEAQELSKEALTSIAPKIEEILNQLQANGIVQHFDVKISPHNSGYEFIKNVKYNMEKLAKINEFDDEIVGLIDEVVHLRLTVQPVTFFNEKWETGKKWGIREAEMEYHTITEDGYHKNYNEGVSNSKELDDSVKSYIELTKRNLEKIYNKINRKNLLHL